MAAISERVTWVWKRCLVEEVFILIIGGPWIIQCCHFLKLKFSKISKYVKNSLVQKFVFLILICVQHRVQRNRFYISQSGFNCVLRTTRQQKWIQFVYNASLVSFGGKSNVPQISTFFSAKIQTTKTNFLSLKFLNFCHIFENERIASSKLTYILRKVA